MRGLKRADWLGIGAFAALWCGSVGYLWSSGGDWTFPLISLGVFAIALSLVAWVTTLGAKAPPIDVARPGLETGAVLAYLALYALVFLGWGMGAARQGIAEGPAQEVFVLALKLGVHVLLPALLLLALGARLAPLVQARINTRAFWATLIVLGAILLGLLCLVSPSLQQIAALNAPIATLAWVAPVSFIWIALEAGLCEEFLFRAVLQTRLSALFRSPWAGVMMTSVLFGLAHAPGLYLRGGPGVDGWSTDPLQVIAYTIATLAPISLFIGFVYARTKSLALVILLHATIDVLPNLPEFYQTWLG